MTNEEYTYERRKLIPEAEEYANRKAGPAPILRHDREVNEYWSANWNRHFHMQMQRLAFLRGLVSYMPIQYYPFSYQKVVVIPTK